MPENQTISPLLMDRSEPIGNSLADDGRRALHTLVTNTDPIPVTFAQEAVTPLAYQATAILEDPLTVHYLVVPAGKRYYIDAVEFFSTGLVKFTMTCEQPDTTFFTVATLASSGANMSPNVTRPTPLVAEAGAILTFWFENLGPYNAGIDWLFFGRQEDV